MAAPRFRFRFGSGPEYSNNSSGSSVNWSSSSSCISQWVSSPGELYATARITNNGVTRDVRASITLNSNIQHGQSYSRSQEHTSELQSLMRISYAVLCLIINRNPLDKKQLTTLSYILPLNLQQ